MKQQQWQYFSKYQRQENLRFPFHAAYMTELFIYLTIMIIIIVLRKKKERKKTRRIIYVA
jgi:prolipoprotein diacylglyceryltransferase